jgi:hypothetical protein
MGDLPKAGTDLSSVQRPASGARRLENSPRTTRLSIRCPSQLRLGFYFSKFFLIFQNPEFKM